MGKLLDALQRRQQALEAHKQQPHRPYELDPIAGYAYVTKLTELNYLNQKANRLLVGALVSLGREQREAIFRVLLSDDALQSFGERRFRELLESAAHAKQPETELARVLSAPGFLTLPLPALLPEIKKMLGPKQRTSDTEGSPALQIARMLPRLSARQRDMLFERFVRPEVKERFAFDILERQVEANKIDGVLKNQRFHRSSKDYWDAVAAIERSIGPEQAEALAVRIDGLLSPERSADKYVRPREAELQGLRRSIAPEDPQAAQKLALLQKAGEILVYPTNEYLEYLDAKDNSEIAGEKGLKSANMTLSYYTLNQFLAKLSGGKFLEKLPHEMSNYAGYNLYSPDEAAPRHFKTTRYVGVDLSEEEQAELREAGRAPMDPQVIQAVERIAENIEALGEKKYWRPGVVELKEGTWQEPVRVQYLGEQGNKKYAFWPLVIAKEAVDKAVQAGDWQQLQQATAEYERCKTHTDEMLRITNALTNEPSFPGNLNSTRTELSGALNPMPIEYLEDYPGHSRVNGVFLLYAMSKNTGVPIRDLMEKPGDMLWKLGQDFIHKELAGLQPDKPLGARLAFSFDRKQKAALVQKWNAIKMPLSRGLSAVVGLMPNQAEREKAAGRNYCAIAAANYEVGKDMVPWNNLSEAGPEQQRMIAQLAVLLPEEEFDLREMGLKLGREDWQQSLDPAAVMERLRREGKLDVEQIIARSRQLCADAFAQAASRRAEGQAGDNGDQVMPIQQGALELCEQLLKAASPRQLEIEPYRRLALHRRELRNGLFRARCADPRGKLRETLLEYGHEMDVLRREKSGYFLRKKNSKEYDEMMKPLGLLNAKLRQLSGDPMRDVPQETLAKLPELDVMEQLEAAKKGCFLYACRKSENGTSNLLHEAGMDRFQAAARSFYLLGEISDQMGLRSPAKRLCDNVQLSTLLRRRQMTFEKGSCERAAARILYAKSVERDNLPFEEQEKLLEKERLNKAIEGIMKQPSFRQMVKNEGVEGLAQKLIQGGEYIQEAYRQALQGKQTAPTEPRPENPERRQSLEGPAVQGP